MNDVHTVDNFNQLELQSNPDFNLQYHENIMMPYPNRPFMLGRPGTALAALREKEASSSWADLSMEEKVKF